MAAVPRPLWSSVTAPSRITLTSRTPCTGVAPLPSLAVVLPPPPPSGVLLLSPSPSVPLCSTELGMYQPHCGLENVLMSWGHDGEAGRLGRRPVLSSSSCPSWPPKTDHRDGTGVYSVIPPDLWSIPSADLNTTPSARTPQVLRSLSHKSGKCACRSGAAKTPTKGKDPSLS